MGPSPRQLAAVREEPRSHKPPYRLRAFVYPPRAPAGWAKGDPAGYQGSRDPPFEVEVI
jgi:hypothetical protein